jgi:tryptophan-rich sensory protein
MKNSAKLIISILICEFAGIIGSIFTAPAIQSWYYFLNKPFFSPPNWIFAPVWTILFLLMGVSLYLVWLKDFNINIPADSVEKKVWNPISKKLLFGSWREENVAWLFVFQLALNILWSVIFFGLKLPGFAFVEILMLWFAILYTIINFYRISKPAAYLLIPYILWVSFATFLNLSIWLIN